MLLSALESDKIHSRNACTLPSFLLDFNWCCPRLECYDQGHDRYQIHGRSHGNAFLPITNGRFHFSEGLPSHEGYGILVARHGGRGLALHRPDW
jgi:hypothetical protein